MDFQHLKKDDFIYYSKQRYDANRSQNCPNTGYKIRTFGDFIIKTVSNLTRNHHSKIKMTFCKKKVGGK